MPAQGIKFGDVVMDKSFIRPNTLCYWEMLS